MLNETRDVSVDLRFSHGFVKGIIPQKFVALCPKNVYKTQFNRRRRP